MDSVGNVYVTGSTGSTDFPASGGPDLTYNGGHDAFVAKANATGSGLIYASFLGGGDMILVIASLLILRVNMSLAKLGLLILQPAIGHIRLLAAPTPLSPKSTPLEQMFYVGFLAGRWMLVMVLRWTTREMPILWVTPTLLTSQLLSTARPTMGDG